MTSLNPQNIEAAILAAWIAQVAKPGPDPRHLDDIYSEYLGLGPYVTVDAFAAAFVAAGYKADKLHIYAQPRCPWGQRFHLSWDEKSRASSEVFKSLVTVARLQRGLAELNQGNEDYKEAKINL